jgi:cytochrome P450
MLRIYPPVPAQPSRQSPPGGETIDGKYIPENIVIYVSQYVTNHLEGTSQSHMNFILNDFSSNQRTKWNQIAHPNSQMTNFAAFQPFSAGPRNCIGRNLACAKMRLILARLFFEFDLELDPRSKDWGYGQKTFVLWEKPALWAKLMERAN